MWQVEGNQGGMFYYLTLPKKGKVDNLIGKNENRDYFLGENGNQKE
jgi:hypothetical protein